MLKKSLAEQFVAVLVVPQRDSLFVLSATNPCPNGHKRLHVWRQHHTPPGRGRNDDEAGAMSWRITQESPR